MYQVFKIARFNYLVASAALLLGITAPIMAAVVQVDESFDTDPLWDGSNNTTGNSNFGFSNTNNTGAPSGPGEVGGAPGNMPRAYYAADVGSLDPSTDTLTMQGTAWIDSGTADDGQVFWGWFDKDNMGGNNRVDNFIGFYTLRDPPYQMRLIWQVSNASNDLAVLFPEVPDQTSFDYEVTFDPNGNGGNGTLSASVTGGNSLTLNLASGVKDAFQNFDRFGMISDRPGPTIFPAITFHDDISYTTNDSVLFALGDFNRDEEVDLLDFNIMKDNWLTSGNETNSMGEVTGDGIVDLKDFKLFKEELFTGPASALATGIPEPSSAMLLVLATSLSLLWQSRGRGIGR